MPRIVTSAVLDASADEVWELLRDYVSGLRVIPASETMSLVEWTAEFDCNATDEPEAISQVRDGIFRPGLAAMKERFA